MDFDFDRHLRAVERSVSSPERKGKPARAVSISRIYPTTIEDLWDAVTSADRIPSWSMPVSGNLELGGRYQLEGNAGGRITECEPLSHFALTWEFGEDVSWVNISVSEDGEGRAPLTLTHTMRHSAHWDEYGPGATGVGWELALLGLHLHITRPDDPMPDETEFATSPEGRAFIAGSGNAWAHAAIVAGAEDSAAQAAANRATAFYTAEPA